MLPPTCFRMGPKSCTLWAQRFRPLGIGRSLRVNNAAVLRIKSAVMFPPKVQPIRTFSGQAQNPQEEDSPPSRSERAAKALLAKAEELSLKYPVLKPFINIGPQMSTLRECGVSPRRSWTVYGVSAVGMHEISGLLSKALVMLALNGGHLPADAKELGLLFAASVVAEAPFKVVLVPGRILLSLWFGRKMLDMCISYHRPGVDR